MCLVHWISGAFNRDPDHWDKPLSQKAVDLTRQAWDDLDVSRLTDYHTHIAGIGAGNTGAFVNSRMLSWRHLFHRMKFEVYLSAYGVQAGPQTDPEVINRLVALIENIPNHGKHFLLAFDKHYRRDGTINLDKTEFYVPNDYVFALAARFPHLFEPAISVHPYRSDALAELEKWAHCGGRIVKWLPNAMGMNPSDPLCDPFYEKMKQLGLVLLSHGGEEKAVEAEEDQKLGNPLLLRRPLDHGVKVVVAHCAGLGTNEDLDSPGREQRSNFALFLRLMDDPEYEGLLFGDISAMTLFNRIGSPLSTVLKRRDLQERLINGSDYPLPAVNILIRLQPLIRLGYLREAYKQPLQELYEHNPILFDFTLKRLLTAPGTDQRFAAKIFMTHPSL